MVTGSSFHVVNSPESKIPMQIIDIIFTTIPDILEKGSQAVQIAVTTNG